MIQNEVGKTFLCGDDLSGFLRCFCLPTSAFAVGRVSSLTAVHFSALVQCSKLLCRWGKRAGCSYTSGIWGQKRAGVRGSHAKLFPEEVGVKALSS